MDNRTSSIWNTWLQDTTMYGSFPFVCCYKMRHIYIFKWSYNTTDQRVPAIWKTCAARHDHMVAGSPPCRGAGSARRFSQILSRIIHCCAHVCENIHHSVRDMHISRWVLCACRVSQIWSRIMHCCVHVCENILHGVCDMEIETV